MATHAADQSTRQRLVEAATRQFAESGYKKVTVRAICREAKANVAAVNYHFRDKLGLYTEVLETAIAVMRESTDEAIRAGQGRPPADQLRSYIHVVSERIFAKSADSWIHQLITREMTDPTPAVSALIERGLRPRLEYLGCIIGALLDRPSDDERVMLCVASVHAQLIMFRPSPLSDEIRARLNLPRLTPQHAADHITAFTIGALAAFRHDAHGPKAVSAAVRPAAAPRSSTLSRSV